VNCRTCLSATPVEGGWRCERHERSLSEADQRAGCDQHLYIPDLVPGEQIDAGTDWVSYQLPGGGVWLDSGRHKHSEHSL
ncbi:MAG: oxidoreductase, partial [Candidatus Accumulibacter sp.]|nr:oxidoreductase [Accumulibacter sp.]